jgi:ParB family chromosome partitioning protein
MALLAELTALTLDLRELRTDQIRRPARADASEIAELCAAEITDHWTPDAAYLSAHSKPMMLAMLEAMGGDVALGKGVKKDEVIHLVAAAAREKRWAPKVLDFCLGDPAEEDVNASEVSGAAGSDTDAAAGDAPEARSSDVTGPQTVAGEPQTGCVEGTTAAEVFAESEQLTS